MLASHIKRNSLGASVEAAPLRFPRGDPDARQYHSLTRGIIMNEVFRRVDPGGRTIGEWLREDVNAKLGTDVYIGLTKEQVEKKATTLEVFCFFLYSCMHGRKRYATWCYSYVLHCTC